MMNFAKTRAMRATKSRLTDRGAASAPALFTRRHNGPERIRSKMKRNEVFPSKYLKAADLNGKPATVKISAVTYETLKSPEGREQNKTVLAFAGTSKLLPLNMTNWDSVADVAGEDTEEWPNKKIEVYPTITQMGGKTVECVRIRKPSAPKQPMLPVVPDDDPDDVIPF